MKKFISIFFILTITPFFIISAIAQPPPPPPQDIPIDSGLFLLFLAGLAFAAKYFYSNYNKKNTSRKA